MSKWSLFSNHGNVLLCLADDPEARLRDVASAIGITERAVQKIVRDLQDGGILSVSKQGRRNRYRINTRKPLQHPLDTQRTVGNLITMMRGERKPVARAARSRVPVASAPPEPKPESGPPAETAPPWEPLPEVPPPAAVPEPPAKPVPPAPKPEAAEPDAPPGESEAPDKAPARKTTRRKKPVDDGQGSLF